jgi:hypothetical protein
LEPAPAPERRELDPAVADVLREEAQHEARAREAEASTLESQPDLGLEEPETDTARRAREARDRMARLRGETPQHDHAPNTEPATDAEMMSAAASRGDILPDIDDINATLRSTGDRKAEAKVGKSAGPAPSTAYRRGRGFRTGFGLTLIVAALAVVAYVNADRIVALVPQSKPVMTLYVDKVTEARYWLDTQMVDVMVWLDEKAAAAGGNPSGINSENTN